MSRLREAWRRVRLAALATPGLRVMLLAIRNYIMHQSANQAGSLAFSSVLAMFPLLILVSASAGFVGQPGDAAALADRVMEYAPQAVRDAMQPVIKQVLAQRNQALLTIGVLATLWTASSGMQAMRSALNRAYGIERGLPFWKARIKVTLFTVIVGAGVLAAFSSVIVMPYVWQLLETNAGAGQDTLWLHNSVRYGSAFLVLSGAVRVAVRLAARHSPAALHRDAWRAGGCRAVGSGCRHPVVHVAHRRKAGVALRQLRRRGRHAGVPVHQRDDTDLRRRNQRGPAGDGGTARAGAPRVEAVTCLLGSRFTRMQCERAQLRDPTRLITMALPDRVTRRPTWQ